MSEDATAARRRAIGIAIGVALVLAIVLIYASVRQAEFFYLDDDFYVTANPFVRDGLTIAGLRRVLFGSYGAHWMPIAFASHMVDASLFGLTPAGPHIVNVIVHALNALLLLALLHRTTGALVPSVLATALFAFHPLRVESVAWIAERKDVLSLLFGLLTLHAWVSYTAEPTSRRFRVVVAGTILAIMAKPMLVTLPVLLLCFDWWPLRRVGTPGPDGRPLGAADLVREKMPLFLVSGAAVVVQLVAARLQGALVALDDRTIPTRLAHATCGYAWYAWKTIWPTNLGVFYPFPAWTWVQVAGAAAVIAAALVVAVRARRSAPWITAGLAWFAIGLLPVVGFFQVGGQGMADRFSYLPSIGFVTAVVWTVHETVRARSARAAFAGVGVVAAVALAVVAHRQVGYWRNSETMLERTLAVTHDNWRMEEALGNVLANEGRHADAQAHFARALAIEPDSGGAAYGLGVALAGLGRDDDAVVHYREAIRLDPTHWRAHNNLGVYLLRHGDLDTALYHFSEAVRLNPGARDATDNLRATLAATGFTKEHADGYLQLLVTWSAAIASDQQTVGGAAYGARLASALLASRAALFQSCAGKGADDGAQPFSLYLQIDANGALTAVTVVPPVAAARCLRDELRMAHAPSPPFAPFHASVVVPPAEG
jgi:tetratricopeptide (TPR) repeat protein